MKRASGILPVEVVVNPSPTADADFSAVLDIIADFIAERALNEARAELAAELGIPVESIRRIDQVSLRSREVQYPLIGGVR